MAVRDRKTPLFNLFAQYTAFFSIMLLVASYYQSFPIVKVDYLTVCLLSSIFCFSLGLYALKEMPRSNLVDLFIVFQCLDIFCNIFMGWSYVYLWGVYYDASVFAYNIVNYLLMMCDIVLLVWMAKDGTRASYYNS